VFFNGETVMAKPQQSDVHVMRHSLAHIMATAIQELHPTAKFGVGPVIENGFYYDVDLMHPLTPDDLLKIEGGMRAVITANHPFERRELPIDEALELFKEKGQLYKVELLNDLKTFGTTSAKDIDREQLGVDRNSSSKAASDDKITTVSLYKDGAFEDLCRGPHLDSTGEAGAFKLTKVSGAYWRGDEKNPQLQRIYGVAFATQDELNTYLRQLEEAEKRDHRKLGKQLDIFEHSELVGAGLPLFTPKGTAMINAMMNLVREINGPDGYEEVRTGHMTHMHLYEISGHAEKFGEDVFHVQAGEEEVMALKPMNCPHHTQLYARDLRSYRDLPIKFAEFSTLHRNEVRGALGGLTRVRALTQDDAHAFVRPDQIEDEIHTVVEQVDRLLGTYGLSYKVRLSLRDPENMEAYLGDSKIWDQAEDMLERLAKKFNMDYHTAEGEAAFYGPKMDFMAVDALGREWQVSTIQLDFNQPERFQLTYIDEKGDKQQPVMIHRALNGTFERMLGILIEHFAGNFPLWLAPEQVRLATVNDSDVILDRAYAMRDALKQAGVRVELDASPESVGKKIRAASLLKVPYTIVVGEKEVESDQVSPRVRADLGEAPDSLTFNEFMNKVTGEIRERAPKSSL
jgi:threonyl-tRNA synthetase